MDEAFTRLVEPHRRELLAHCYRMLGSVHDAEDALQESLLRAWTALGEKDEKDDRPIRPWLYRIATNRCLTLLEKRDRRELPADLSPGAPLTEVAWLEPFPDRLLPTSNDPAADVEQREGVELAFVAALQHLSPNQRAVLVLREVLGFSAAETADLLETSVASVNSGLQRARKQLADRRPAVSQQSMQGTTRIKELAEKYVAAWHARDVDAIVALLAADATFSMPPLAEFFVGRTAIAGFLRSGPMPYRWVFVPCGANAQLAFANYMWKDEEQAYVFAALEVLTVRDDEIVDVTAFLSWDLWEIFGVPMSFRAPPGDNR
jgi:RNA polymerase sigma-70 factor (ECF subfamily)